MEKIVVYGSGGLAREIIGLIERINNTQSWEILGYLDDDLAQQGKVQNGYPILGGREWLTKQTEKINVVIAIGNPLIRKKIAERLSNLQNIDFPNIIHPDISLSKYCSLGKGVIICEGSILTCNIQIGDFVLINLNCTIGHDSVIESYVTLSPNASISGNTHLKQGVDFGTNATLIQGYTVGLFSIIGGGAVVNKDIPDHCTAVGVPAKPIKFHQ